MHTLAPGSDKAAKYLTPVSGVGPFLLGAVLLFIAGAVVYWRVRKGPEEGVRALGYRLVAAGFALLTLGLALLIWRIVNSPEITLPAAIRLAPGEHGPFHLSLASNYALGLMALVWGTTLGFLLTTPLRDRISAGLPDPRKLEDITYRVIIAGWPLLTIWLSAAQPRPLASSPSSEPCHENSTPGWPSRSASRQSSSPVTTMKPRLPKPSSPNSMKPGWTKSMAS